MTRFESRCPAVLKRGDCAFPLPNPQAERKARSKALRRIRRELGRRLRSRELGYLEGSEVFHEFRYRVWKNEPVLLAYDLVDGAVDGPASIESWLATGLQAGVVHAK